MVRIRRVFEVALMLAGLLALPVAWMLYQDGESRRAAAPPWSVNTLAEFRKWRPQYQQALKLEYGGATYYLVFGERARVLASGKSAYLFDARGNYIGWVNDIGDDQYLRIAISQDARKGSLDVGQIVVSPPSAPAGAKK
jgi:hypothetical protein